MKQLRKSFLYFVLAIGLLTIDACRKKYNSTAKDMSDYGWILYEEAKTSDDYIESNTWFKDGIKKDSGWKDAYNGLGWSFGQLMVLDSSISNFIDGLDKPKEAWITKNIQAEILAGLTFAYKAQGNNKKALQYGSAFLDTTFDALGPGWEFSHDPDSLLNHLDVRIAMASSYFAIGKFDSSIVQISFILQELAKSGKGIAMAAVTDTSLQGRKRIAAQIDSLYFHLTGVGDVWPK